MRVTPQAAADLMGLMRLIADPDETKKHLDEIVAKHGDLAARQHDLDERVKAVNLATATNADVAAECDKRQKALSDREIALNKQAADIELRVRNHGVDVAKHRADVEAFETIRSAALDDLNKQRSDLAERETNCNAKADWLSEWHAAVMAREADVQQANDALDARHKKLREALA